MREILFRAKRKDNGEWVEGFYCGGNERNTLHPAIFIYLPDKQSYDYQNIDINTLGQYTGLCDKNGTKIFEGDVVMKRTYHKKKPCEVVFGVGCFHCGWGGGSSTKDHPYLLNDKQIEVIGNAHDNPELLNK